MDRCVATVCAKENERLLVTNHMSAPSLTLKNIIIVFLSTHLFFSLLHMCGKTEYIASNSVQYLCQIIDFGSWFVWKTEFRIDSMPLSLTLCCPFTSLVL